MLDLGPRKFRKLLLVDDSKTVVEQFKLRMECAGFEVSGHTNPMGTLIAVLREKPDLILLDVTMPGLEGPELCKMIRKDRSMGRHGGTPVLLYSSLQEDELKNKVAECEANGYVHKSWDFETQVSHTRKHLVDRAHAVE
jgi:twitching motility two-component system response regulator PilG